MKKIMECGRGEGTEGRVRGFPNQKTPTMPFCQKVLDKYRSQGIFRNRDKVELQNKTHNKNIRKLAMYNRARDRIYYLSKIVNIMSA